MRVFPLWRINQIIRIIKSVRMSGLFQRSVHPLMRTSGLSVALLYNVLCVLNITYKVLPLWVQVSLVGQAALHDVGTVVGAGFDGGHAATVWAVNQLHQGLHTLWT